MEDDVDINMLTMEQYLASIQDDIRPGVVKPKISNDVKFEINSNFMRELRCKLFKGTDDEDAHEHVRMVLEIVDLFHFPGVTHDAVMLRVFPITLKGPALRWINRLLAGLVTTWDLLKKAFIRQYCPPFKTAKKLEIIRNFKQEMDETLYHAWERYNDLLYRCPQHDLNSQQKVHIFYTRLDIPTRIMLDSKEFIPLMIPAQALKSIQVMEDHSHNWYDEATTKESINDSSDNANTKKLKENIHAIQEKEGDMDDGWDITIKDVERLRQILTPTIHTLPNLEIVVQPYKPLGPVRDKAKVIREKKHDYDIPLHNGVMQPLTPKTIHITPPDDDYVASATNLILDKHLNKCRKELFDMTGISKLRKGIQDHTDSFSCDELCGYVLWKPSRDFTRPLGPPSGLKGLLHMLNATVIPMKVYLKLSQAQKKTSLSVYDYQKQTRRKEMISRLKNSEVADRVVAPTPGSAITIPETENEFSIKALFDRLLGEIRAFSQHENESLTDAWLRMKEMLRNCHASGIFLYKIPNQAYQLLEDKVLLKLDWAKNQKPKSSLKKTVAFAAEGRSTSDIDKIMARMDAMTIKMDAQYKDFQSRSKQPNFYDDDIPMSREEEAKFMQTFHPKFDRFADKQSARPSGSLPSNTQPNPKGSSSKPYQPPQARNEHVNTVFTRSAVRINIPLVDVLAGMPNYGKFLKELINNKHKIKQISVAFLSDESFTILQNKVPPKLRDPRSFLIPCNFNKAFSCNALVDLGASINLIPYSLYAKLSLETLKPTKMSVRLADRSFQCPVGIAENMLVEVGKFTFPAVFIILEMEEDSKVPLILERPFLHTADAVIRAKQKQLNLRVGTERTIFHIDSAMKHSYSNEDTCFSIDVIDEILEEDFDALLDEGSKILHSIDGTILKEKFFAEFDEFMAMTADENSESESDIEEPPFEKITFNTDYKIKTSLKEPPTDLELKPLPDNLEYVFLEEPYFLLVII
ncbi:reverse transcriptase domain-containing protein [Tanacetum coccineum]